jgi:hypothetical protein
MYAHGTKSGLATTVRIYFQYWTAGLNSRADFNRLTASECTKLRVCQTIGSDVQQDARRACIPVCRFLIQEKTFNRKDGAICLILFGKYAPCNDVSTRYPSNEPCQRGSSHEIILTLRSIVLRRLAEFSGNGFHPPSILDCVRERVCNLLPEW